MRRVRGTSSVVRGASLQHNILGGIADVRVSETSHDSSFVSSECALGCCCGRCVAGDISNPVRCIDDIHVSMVANFCEIFAQVRYGVRVERSLFVLCGRVGSGG